jgi:2-polyprenyl-6-methoxyphenol hydroxylase-like FAD-dependent oxidoreductase
MLLARGGYRVLLVDRATFPSDTISTQFIWPPGVAALKRWGLLDRLRATGCPPVAEIGLDVGAFRLQGAPPATPDGAAEMYCPRRTVLDKLLVDAAAEAGAEVVEGFTMTGLTIEDGRVTGIRGHGRQGSEAEYKARIVVGADGRHSAVAAAAGAETYNARPVKTCCYYSFWRGIPPHLTAIHARDRRVLVTTPTNDGLTIAIVIFPIEEFDTVKRDIEGRFMAAMDQAPYLAEMLRAGERVERFYGTGDIENFFRKPFGDGWALAGDAGYHKDPCTAQGISDAFRSAEWLADAIRAGLSGERPMDQALAEYQRVRDEHLLPMYELTFGLAHLAPPPPEIQMLYQALRSNRRETDRFFGTLAGTVPIPEYYAPGNLARIVETSERADGVTA